MGPCYVIFHNCHKCCSATQIILEVAFQFPFLIKSRFSAGCQPLDPKLWQKNELLNDVYLSTPFIWSGEQTKIISNEARKKIFLKAIFKHEYKSLAAPVPGRYELKYLSALHFWWCNKICCISVNTYDILE